MESSQSDAESIMILSIGYSGLDQNAFLELLQEHKCAVVCDVRSVPYSRYRPEFSRREFKAALNARGIKYAFFGDMLGARPKSRECYDGGTAKYELIEQLPLFQTGLDRVAKGAEHDAIALVCSEADPIECHRSILVAKNLVGRVPEIKHIHSNGMIETQPELEERLIDLYGTAPPPLLRSVQQRKAGALLAYEKQASAICYSEAKQWKTR